MSMLREPDAEPIPGYRLVEPLGSGGFGEVWRCVAPGGIAKAIKFVYGNLNSEDGDAHKAEQEQKALERVKAVRHPFILSMDRIEVLQGELAIVMELADRSLHDLLEEHRRNGDAGIPRANAVRYLMDAAEGLDHLIEKHNLQHLDIKPRNLFLIGDRVKVADFGLLKQIERQSSVGLMGGMSPLYAAPETFTGKVSKHTDQYSLAIVYCELVGGRRPFSAKTIRQLAMQHMSEPPDLSMLLESDRAVVGRALAKDPNRRFPNCHGFIQALASATTCSADDDSDSIDIGHIPHQHPNDGPATEMLARVPIAQDEQGLSSATIMDPDPPADDDGPATAVYKSGIAKYSVMSDTSSDISVPSRSGDSWGDSDAHQPPKSEPAWMPPAGWIDPVDLDGAVDFGGSSIAGKPDHTGTIIRKGVLRPTLFIGLGAFGRKTLLELRCRLLDRFGDLSQIPAYRFLYLDSDPQAIDVATQGTPEVALTFGETFILPLQPVINYRRRMIDHLTVWLPREKLHGIPRSLQPQGSRALGRLAFIDNFPRLQSRLRREFQIATHPDSIESSVVQTGLSRGKEAPRVFVFASACGGSSGTTVDLGYALKRLLRQLNYSDSQVTLFNFLGSPRDPSSSRLELANAYATLLELNHYRQPDVAFAGQFGPDAPSFTDGGSPFDSVYLASTQERSGNHYRDAVAHLATYVTQDVSSPLGPTLARSRRDDSTGRKPAFRSFGTFTVWFPRGLLLRVAARRAVAKLIDVWNASVLPKSQEEIERLCTKAVSDPGLRWESLAGELNRLATTPRDGTPLDAIERFLDQLEKESQGPSAVENPGAWTLAALDRVRRLAGPGTGRELESLWKKSQFIKDLTRASQLLSEHWDTYLSDQLGELIRTPGNRLANLEAGLRRLMLFCDKGIRLQWDAIERHYQGMKRLRDELESAQQGCTGGVKKLFGGTNRALRSFVEAAKTFARQRIAQDLLETGVQFFMTLQGRLEDRIRDLSFARTRMKHLKQALSAPLGSSHAAPVEWGSAPGLEIIDPFWETVQGTATVQVVLPAGATDLEASADQFVASLRPEHWLGLDEFLQNYVLAPLGDLINASTAGNEVANYFGRPLVEATAMQLGTILPITDVAQVQFANAKQSGESINSQLHDYMMAASPLVADDAREEAFVLVPETTTGDEYGRTAKLTVQGVQVVAVSNPIELTVLREQSVVGDEAIEDLMANARIVYQQMVGVPTLSPHARFDLHDWRPLGRLVKTP